MGQKHMSTDNANHPDWVKRLEELFDEKDSNKSNLAKALGISKGTVTGWFSGTKGGPSIALFAAIANHYGVSLDYLWGRAECERPENEVIHKVTGLSDKAINELKTMQEISPCGENDAGEIDAEKKMVICNYLIEAMSDSSFFEDLYDYLFGEFYFENKDSENRQETEFIVSKSPSGKESRLLAFNSTFTHAHLSMVYRDLSRMKDEADRIRETKEKTIYETWKDSDESNALNEEFYKMLDSEEEENAKK